MVEQATHNRQVTGSNPVGATFYFLIADVSFPFHALLRQTLRLTEYRDSFSVIVFTA